ncbi:hypothetical protein KEF29_35220 [Streptomyces tuirus]|uniref:Uncharacterized protein n=1 Tax=Streptomyces tuirus TaxID=68278 RepID=A0A941FF98_9ACTN|nr:hypothetical protein [Streptomyces tuirus]
MIEASQKGPPARASNARSTSEVSSSVEQLPVLGVRADPGASQGPLFVLTQHPEDAHPTPASPS